jgi:hypothetical protein
MRTLPIIVALGLGLLACKDSSDHRTPCERVAANGQRLAGAGETPYPVERCEQDQLSRAELSCLGYASSWDEYQQCAPERVHASGAR